MLLVLEFVAAVGGTALVIELLEPSTAPYAWAALIWAAVSAHRFVSLLRARHSPNSRDRRALWLNIGFVFVVIGGVEFALSVRQAGQENTLDGDYVHDYFVDHDVLGYAPKPGMLASSTSRFEDTLLYDVHYTIDESGLRLAPPHENGGDECLVFMGGSYTFGEGVEDNETLPWQVGIQSGARYRVYNFGFHGYGPHQMLSALEQGYLEERLECRVVLGIYLSVYDHVARAAGNTSWDHHGPKYEVGVNGEAVYSGHFDDGAKFEWPEPLLERLNKSAIFLGLHKLRLPTFAADYELFFAIVDTARRRFEIAFPESEFHVLLWDTSGHPPAKYWTGLRERGVRVHLVGDILPRLHTDRDHYEINPRERHPNALLYRQLAAWTVDHLVPVDGTGPDADP